MKSPLVIITHEFFPKRGGIAVYTDETARAATKLGYQTEVWAPQSPNLADFKFPYAIKQLPIKGNLGWPERRITMQAMMQAQARLSESIVLLPEPGPILAAMYLEALRKLPAKKLSIVLHGSEILRCTLLPHRRAFFKKLLQRTDTVGVVSRYARKLLLRHYPFASDKVKLVPGGLRSDFLAVQHQPASKEKVTILSVGRMHPRKGQHCLLEAAALLPKNVKDKIRLCLAGPLGKEAYSRQLKVLAAECGVEVELPGEVPDEDLPELYARADIFALTSMRTGPSVEGFGLVTIEAGATGLPVIAHRSGGIPEAVIEGQTGIIVNPYKRGDLAAAIERLAFNPDLRKRLGDGGKARAQQLSWEHNVEQLLTF